MLHVNHFQTFTCSRQDNAASRYFFTFFVHAEDTRVKMELGVAGSSAEIALWQAIERAPIACKRASFPCKFTNITKKEHRYPLQICITTM